MRQLRLLTRSDDGDHLLVETDDGLERFALPVDATLRAAVTAVQRQVLTVASGTGGSGADPDQPAIGPREIQVRVRSGESPEDLAAEHGMSLERVMRFAAPVVAERTRITDEAHRARARRTSSESGEPAVVVFGEAVTDRFEAYGIEASTVSWDSRRRDDGVWLVSATWIGGDGEHGAEWSFDRGSRSVAPLDGAAADLLSNRPIRPVTPPPPVAAVPRLTSGVIAFPPFPDAHTGPIERVEEVFDQEAPAEGPRDLPPFLPQTPGGGPGDRTALAGPGSSAHPDPDPVPTTAEEVPIDGDSATAEVATIDLRFEDGSEFIESPLPLAIKDSDGRPAANVATLHTLGARREETEEDKASRARIPSWDDILLGVRRKQD